jgi:hypothetical protein
MKTKIIAAAFAAFVAIALTIPLHAAEQFSAKQFAGTDGLLDSEEAGLYAFLLKNEGLRTAFASGYITRGALSTSPPDSVLDKLNDFQDPGEGTGHGPPWKWQELDALYAKPTDEEAEAAIPAWRKVEGFTKAKVIVKKEPSAAVSDSGGKEVSSASERIVETGSWGPIMIRKNSDELAKDDFTKAKGATLGFANNYLIEGNGAWNSEGIIFYPINRAWQGKPGSGSSFTLQTGPATEWKLAETEEASKQDVQEFTFSLPITGYFVPPGKPVDPASDRKLSAIWVFQGKPYFQSDFSLEHEIYGAETSVEFVGSVFGSDLVLGDFQNIGGSGLMQYRVRLVPKIDYSTTEKVGPHTSRKAGDDWFRIGGLASFDLRIGGEKSNPLDLGVSYQGMDTLNGSGDYSDLFKAHVTWWVSDYTGVTLEYSKGETPVSDKDIDLVTFGLELRF